MKELQTLAMGLVVVFLDIGTPDCVADPIGWVLVLIALAAVKESLADYSQLMWTGWACLVVSVIIWPPQSVAHLDDSLGWAFSLPTIAFCFLLCQALAAICIEDLAQRFSVLAWVFVGIALLPLLIYGVGWDWLTLPAAIAAVLVNITLVFSLFSASDEGAVLTAETDDAAGDPSSDGSADPGKHRA